MIKKKLKKLLMITNNMALNVLRYQQKIIKIWEKLLVYYELIIKGNIKKLDYG